MTKQIFFILAVLCTLQAQASVVEYGFYLFHSMFVKLHASNNSLVFAQ